jgi:hypothetical protein
MQTVGAQWLLLDNGPALVALVQTAASLPVFLLALPAGGLADLTDRWRLLELAQYGMAAVAGVLAVLATTVPCTTVRYWTGRLYISGPSRCSCSNPGRPTGRSW